MEKYNTKIPHGQDQNSVYTHSQNEQGKNNRELKNRLGYKQEKK